MKEFKRLNEFVEGRTGQFLTARTTKAWLEKSESKKTLYVVLKKDSEILTTSKERREHFENVDREWFEKQLKKWNKKRTKRIEIATPEHPLEVVTGDTCPILKIEGERYVLSFYRDIVPQGWLIPGGCPRNFQELLNPKITARREFCEEVLIGDIQGRVYSFYSLDKLKENCKSWKLEPTEIKPIFDRELSLEKGHASDLVMKMGSKRKRTENISIIIDAEIASVSATIYWEGKPRIKLSDLRIFDGEKLKDGSLLNRPVRLTNVKDESLAAIFVHGQNILSADWITPTTEKRATIS